MDLVTTKPRASLAGERGFELLKLAIQNYSLLVAPPNVALTAGILP